MVELGLAVVLVLMIVGSIVALELRCLLSAVTTMGGVGLGVSLAFLLLQAPDLALVQLIFEILALIIMVRATVKVGVHRIERKHEYLVIPTVFIGILVFVYMGIQAAKFLPAFGEPLMDIAGQLLKVAFNKTGASNIVASVILDIRAFDTLGEALVLFTAVLGVLVVTRKRGRK